MVDCTVLKFYSYEAAAYCQTEVENKTGVPHIIRPEEHCGEMSCHAEYKVLPVKSCFDGTTINDIAKPEFNFVYALWCSTRLARLSGIKHEAKCDNETMSCSVRKVSE